MLAKKWLYVGFASALGLFSLAACQVAAKTNSSIPQETVPVVSPTPTIPITKVPVVVEPEPTPVVEPTPTAEPITILSLELTGGIEGIPDPKISNPELFDLAKEDAPIPQFVNAMKMAGIEITGQQIIDALNDQNYFQEKTGFAGNHYMQFRYKVVDEKGANYSIAFNYSPENGWVLSTLKELGMMYNLEFGAHGIARRIGAIRVYNETLANYYNLVMSEGEFRIETVRPDKDSPYNFTKADAIVKFAASNGMKIQVHHLVRDEMRHYPDWLTNGSLSQQELQQALTDYITQTVGHFKGQVQQWSVINEPFDGNNNPWIIAFGKEKHMQVAFDTARTADPSAILLINERLMETDSKRVNLILKTVLNLNSEKHRVDGVGFQLHIDGSRPPTEDQVIEAMEKFTDAGIAVYVTELEVDMTKVGGSDIDKQKKQAKIYAEMFRACIEAGCRSITTFGFSDSVSSLGDGDESLEAAPLPFNKNFEPKPALFALLDVILNITIN